MHARLYDYLNKLDILDNHQFGFRKNYSTSLALLDVVSMIQKQLYSKNFVMGIFMDLQKAFDTVDHYILLQKT